MLDVVVIDMMRLHEFGRKVGFVTKRAVVFDAAVSMVDSSFKVALLWIGWIGMEDDRVLGTFLLYVVFELFVAVVVLVGFVVHLIELVHDGIRFGAFNCGSGFIEVTVFVDGFD